MRAPARRRGARLGWVTALAAVLALAAPAGAVPTGAAPASGITASGITVPGTPLPVGDLPSVACDPRTEPVPRGEATLVSSRPSPGAEERITEHTLHSPALGRETRVNVLAPHDFDAEQRYPVLYLLHGAAGNHRDWQTIGAVQRVVDEARAAHGLPPFLVVMPDAGAFGFYTDWFGLDVTGHNGTAQAPGWATHHIDELIGWVDANLPTIAARSGRAVAGLSMGGFGAMSYAARFPHLFTAAGSFSGALHPSWSYPAGNIFLTGASGFFTGGQGLDQCIWGEFATQQVRWLGADPTYLAENLAGADMTLYVASGGGYVEAPQGFVTDPVEQVCYEMSRAFTDALEHHGVPAVVDFYAEGGHEWVWWQRKLGEFLPLMAEAFAAGDPGAPEAFAHRSIEPSFSAWGWDFSVTRDVTEFVYLRDVGAQGLTATGSGRLEVVTAPLYTPGELYAVASTDETVVAVVPADDDARLRFTVDLGPSNGAQQLVFDEPAATAGWTETTVMITPLG